MFRNHGEPTVPGRLDRERAINAFLRWGDPALARGRDAVSTFTALRERKDQC